ncbi:MAG: hypothetical protein KGL39_37555 [Patescibacteria group bacterium]|nr:hypothetical protein [Patescibacteria group bacterium]
MADVKAFWGAVKETASRLPDECYYVVSLEKPSRGITGGTICHVTRECAARLLVEETHRLAEPAEVQKYLAAQEVAAGENAKKERERLLATNPLLAAMESAGAKKETSKK